jgi:hypothetical protein
MKKHFLLPFIFCLLGILLYPFTAAPQAVSRRDCYTSYKRQGDAFNKKGKYDLAIQQYQNAKYCPNLPRDSISLLNALIDDAKRRQQRNNRKVITRKF